MPTLENQQTVYNAVKSWSSAHDKAGKQMVTVIDALVASGVTVATLDDKESPYRQSVDDGIVASFGAAIMRLMDTPTKELDDARKVSKRYAQQQVGSRRSKIKKQLDARLNPVEQGPTPRKPDDKFLREWLAIGEKRITTSEGAGDIDLVAMMEWIATCPIK
jgi:hypothetical protein